MSTRGGLYVPPIGACSGREPSGQPPPRARVDAASALSLLECDPQTVLARGRGAAAGSRVAGSRASREKSAAKLALEQYASRVVVRSLSPVDGDLLDFDAASPPGMATPSAPLAGIATIQADDGALWPGDSVMARFRLSGSFHRARIVLVYSQGGATLADVEWLRPQVGMPDDMLFLCCAHPGEDDTQHRQGLQVDADIRRSSDAHQALAPSPQLMRGAHAEPSLELLDFGPAALASAQVGGAPDPLLSLDVLTPPTTVFSGVSVEDAIVAPPHLPSLPPSAGPGGRWAALRTAAPLPNCTPHVLPLAQLPSPPIPSALVGAPAAQPAPATDARRAPERFDFISELMSQATDKAASSGA